ncbi:molybdenum ABC transporter ATP-binding protein [Aquamicrobium sp. LC103]|uniref:molybdenum ABC transporter ATP-binding protein n=1 Tax=Aquamicrobium sp. LC103 TaxID=1120658 RepID=UPI0010C9F5D0|nr:molybdenum ABC transporter ATP-binding protein [Aquamicrobium sp. LC103]TKT79282.1 molybdenum ABC transporter ATP-binding protein [Aquamicrobium sp. LC103]
MTLSVEISHRLGDFSLEASFESDGGLTALFGPSGSGKTSLVNLIGGLIRPKTGRIVADSRVLVDTKTRTFLPKHKRRIGYVFQDARLFPHLSVSQNLCYGRWFTPSNDRYANMEGVIDLLGIGHLLDRRPAFLSGGEKQRVAIGRALIASPRLILMDEPLASLDEARKAEIMPYIERLRDETKIPIVYVSHSIAEVARLATDVVMLSAGRVTAAGPTAQVMQRIDLLPAEERGEGGAVLDMSIAAQDERYGMTVLRSSAGEMRVPRLASEIGRTVRIRIRARDVIVATSEPRGISALNILAGKVEAVKFDDGAGADIGIDCGGQKIIARITRQSVESLGLSKGQSVFAIVKTVSFETAT